MSLRFAFRVSIRDWIRKLSHAYEVPIDFVDNLVGAMYRPGAKINIKLDDTRIYIKSDATIDDIVFEHIAQGSLTTLVSFIPPSKDFGRMEIVSGSNYLEVDPQRNFAVKDVLPEQGTCVVIERTNARYGDEKRLRNLYKNSDIDVTLNGEAVDRFDDFFPLETPSQTGAVVYNPMSTGGITYFVKGRMVSKVPFIRGIDVMLYRHDAPITITKSKVITGGKGKASFDALQAAIPEMMADFLKSEYVDKLRRKSEGSYQSVLRSIYSKLGENPVIAEIVRENIQFIGNDGDLHPNYSIDYVREHPSSIGFREERKLYTELTGEELEERVSPPRQKKGFGFGRVIIAASLVTLIAGGAMVYSSFSPENRVEVAAQQSGVSPQAISVMLPSSLENVISGGDYMSRDDLAKALIAEKDQSGYLRDTTSNRVSLKNGNIVWDTVEPSDKLVSNVHIPLPPDLIRVSSSSDDEKIAAVNRFMQFYFLYGEISPQTGKKYQNMFDAMIEMRRAICSNANSMAAVFLEDLDVKNIRYAVGTMDGIGHAWLEVNKDGTWKIVDFTPLKMDPSLHKRINEFGGAKGQASVSQNYLNRLDPGLTIQNAFESIQQFNLGSYSIQNELDRMIHNPVAYLGSGLITPGIFLMGSSLMLLLGAGAYSGISKMRRKTLGNDTFSVDEDVLAIKKMTDLLGMDVKPSELLYRQGSILYLPRRYLKKSPLGAATELVETLDFSPKQKMGIYSRIANSAE